MKKINNIFTYIVAIIILFGCTKKKMEFDIVQDLCKKFKITSPTYQTLIDPCGDSTLSASFDITFTFDGDEECLHSIISSPIFYTKKNDEISNVSFNDKTVKPDFFVEGTTVTYTLDLEFASQADAQSFNHMVLDFKTQNEVENESNTLQIRLNTTCSVVDESTYEVNSNSVNVSPLQNTFQIILWDNAAEDGDIVSVYLNEEWIIENHMLLNDSTFFNISTDKLNSGQNDLVVFALNEGTSGPNTVSIAVNGKEIKSFNPGLLTGEAVRIDF